MLIVMRAQATEQDIAQVCARIQSLGFRAHVMPGAERTAVGITGNHGPVPPEEFEAIGNQVRKLGFKLVASGPFVRSSYHAGEMATALA